MSKKKSIVILSIILALTITAILFIFPLNGEEKFQIGKSDYDFYWVAGTIKLGLDLEGGMYAVYEADMSEFTSSEDASQALSGTMANLQTLLFAKGYTEAVVTKQGDKSIRVEIPAVSDTEQLISLLGEPAKLEFKDGNGNVLISGSKHLKDAQPVYNNGYYAVSLAFNEEGTKAFAEATQANIGSAINIYINDSFVIGPTVNSAITDGNAIISGNYTYEQANELAVKIKAGTFAVSLIPKQISTISPTLGKDALKYGVMAGLIGLLVIIIFMIVVYKGLGVAASFALTIYATLMIYAMALVPWVQLTLPGIAGIILSIGMAVDANIIIFEKIKDERRFANRALQSSVKAGFKKAFLAIFDANVTTVMGCIVMLIFGSTAIQSFAITLLIGIILSMFTAIVVTRLLLKISFAFNDESVAYYGLDYNKLSREAKGGEAK